MEAEPAGTKRMYGSVERFARSLWCLESTVIAKMTKGDASKCKGHFHGAMCNGPGSK